MIATVVIAVIAVAWVMNSKDHQQTTTVTKTSSSKGDSRQESTASETPPDSHAHEDECVALEHAAKELFLEGAYNAAIEKLIQCSNSDPTSHVKLWNVGVMLSRIGVYGVALCA